MSESIFTTDRVFPNTEKLLPVDKENFRNIVLNRRSVRKYSSEKVPDSVIEECLDLALLAPNSSNLQAWEFYWVKSEEKKKKLVEYCFSQNAAKSASHLIVAVARIDHIHKHRKQMIQTLGKQIKDPPKMLLDYYNKLVPLAYGIGPLSVLAPFKWLLFTILGFFRPMPREPLGKAGLQLWAAKTTALACENFMLAVAAHGYDTCPMEGLDSRRVKKLLGLPRSSVVVMAISVGRRLPEGVYGERVRFPREQFIYPV
jgi:nitroreductase